MNNKEREILKEQFINLYLEGKTMKEISELTGWSRNYVGKIIKNDERIKNYKNHVTLKIYKYKKQNKMTVPISVGFLEKIGISKDINIEDYVDVIVDENDQKIIIKKHKI